MEKIKRRSIKTACSLLLSLLLLLTGMPLEGVGRVFAAASPTITKLTLKMIRKGDVTWAGIDIRGTGFKPLKDREILFNGTDITKMKKLEIIDENDTSERYEITYPITDGNTFQVDSENTVTISGKDENGNSVRTRAYFTGVAQGQYPTLDFKIDQKQFLNQPFTHTGTSLGVDGSSINIEERKLILGGVDNPIKKISKGGTKLEVEKLKGPAGTPQDLAFQIKFNGSGNRDGSDSNNKKDLIYQYVLYKIIVPVEKLKFDDIDAVPNSGPISGGTTLTIIARDKKGKIIKDAFDDSPDFQAFLVPNEGNQAPIPLIREKKEKKDEFIAKTPKVGKESLGKYKILIKKGNAEVTSKSPLFTYITDLSKLELTGVKDSFAFDVEEKTIIITGANIFGLASLNLGNKSGMQIEKTEVATDGIGNPVLKVTYTPKTGQAVTYGEKKEVAKIERLIGVEIGKPATPIQGEVKTDAILENGHYSFDGVDGILFKTPDMTGVDISTSKEVRMETATRITLKGASPTDDKVLSPVYDEAVLSEPKFKFHPTIVNPTVTEVEPLHGYYNFITKKKPLMVRIKGTHFQTVKEGNKVIFPEVQIRKFTGGENYDALAVKVLKVLKGKEIADGEQITEGDTLVAEISPANGSHTSFAKIIKDTGTSGNGYKFLPVKFYISQPKGRGNNLSTIQREKPMELRYPISREVQLQPTFDSPDSKVKLGVFNGKQPQESMALASVLNSDEENEIIVKFQAVSITDFDKVTVTIDGMDMKSKIVKRDYDPIDASPYIALRTPTGIYGETKLQVIVNEGLMDSYDLIFQPVTGPFLKKLIPDNGQAGTWITIKRDTEKNNVGFVIPPGTDKNEGSVVLMDGKKVPEANFEVKDRDTIIFKIPESASPGMRSIQVENPANTGTSQPLPFLVRDVHGDKIEIQSIDPNRGDQKGGIPTTITAKQGTNFSGGVDIYFGSQKAEIIGENLDSTKIFVKVPPFVEKILPAGESYAVPVTVQKKESGVTATVKDGFTYFNPTDGDKLKITEIYKKDVIPKTNTGNAGDEFWIEGTNFLLDIDPKDPKKVIYPDIFFGYERAEILEKYTPEEVKKDPRVARLLVRVPKPTSGLKSDAGAVDVMIINPNGATFTKKKGFIYTQGKPQILSQNLEASRFDGKVKIEAKDVFKDPYVIFGDKVNSLDLAKKEDLLLTTHSEIEKVLLKYLGPDVFPNFELYYQSPDGKNTLMSDATDGGKITLKNLGEKKLVKINWKNPDYHKNSNIAANKELMKRLHDEYMLLELVRDGRVNKLQVTRGLGKVDKYTLNPKDNVATLMVSTPYHEKIEKTKVTIVNTDGSSAEAPFTFNDSTGTIDITDIEGSSLRDVTVGGKSVKAKVKTRDVSAEGNIKILGSGFKDITSVKIGGKEVKVESLSPSGDFMIVTVPKGSEADVGKPLSIDIESKNGNVFSDEKEPPIYFMYIVAGSKPVIENLEPAEGPRTGGTRVKITGSGFREKDGVGLPGKIKLTVNGSAPIEIERFERDKQNEITALYAIMPKGETGKVKIQIINADEGTSDPKEFTYISQPVITKAGDAVFFNDAETEVTLTVEDLQEGAEVIIGAEMKKGLAKGEKKPQNVTAEGMLGVRNGENLTAYVIGGQKAKDVKVSKEKGTLSFKLPAGIEELEKMSVIIRNPDSGISEPKDNIIKPPIPDTPIIYAEPGAEGSVVLSWKVDLQALNAAEKFEVYAKLSSDSEYTFVGDTKQDTPDQAYIVKGLEHGTSYDFKVRVLNKYGEAKDLGYVRGFTLSASNDYKQQEKQAAADRAIEKIQTEGKQEIVGTTLRYTVGTAQTAVDFTKNGKYKEKQLQIPVRDILTNRGKVLFVTDGKINLQLSHAALSVPELSKASEDAFLRVSFSQPDKKKEDALRSAIGRKSTRLSPIYKLDFELVEPKKTLKIKQLAGTISIGFPAGEAGYPAEYMDRNDRFERLSGTAISKGGYYVLLKDKNK